MTATRSTHDRDQARQAARRHAQTLDNGELAHRLVTLAELPRSVNSDDRYALLFTAANRLRASSTRTGSKRTVTAEANVVDGLGGIMLLQHWMGGEAPGGLKFDLCHGGGLGSGMLRLTISNAAGRVLRTETIDMKQLLRSWLSASLADLDAE